MQGVRLMEKDEIKKNMETSHKIKRLKRVKEENRQREKGLRFGEEFSEEQLTKEQLDRDLPTKEI